MITDKQIAEKYNRAFGLETKKLPVIAYQSDFVEEKWPETRDLEEALNGLSSALKNLKDGVV